MSVVRWSKRHLVSLRVAATIGVVVSLPMFAALIVLIGGQRWFPCGDMAQAELHMRGFLSHPPLVGAAGRIVNDNGFQGSHPGPSLWVLMYPVYALGGRTSAALMTSVVSVHLLSIIAALWLVVRRWGRSGAWSMGLIILVLLRSSGSDFMVEPWNVWMALLPFLVMMLLLVDVVAPLEGDDDAHRVGRWILAIVVGSHCVQSHAGYLVIVVAALLGSGIVLLRETKLWRRMLFLGMFATLVMWSAPLIDQLRRSPGNLTILREHFSSPSEPYISLSMVARIITTEFNLFGPWITGPGFHVPPNEFLRWFGFIAMGALVGIALRRGRGTSDQRALFLINGTTLVAMLSVVRIFGPYYEYTVRFFWILTGLNVYFGARVLLRNRNWLSYDRVVHILTVTLVALTTFQAVDGLHLPGATDSRIVSILAPQLRARLDHSEKYLVRMYDPYTLNATGFGTLLELGRSGFNVGVDPMFSAAALPHRVYAEGDVDSVLWVVVGEAIDTARRDPDLTEVASADPRSSKDERTADELKIAIRAGLEKTGRSDLLPLLDRPGAQLLFAEPPLDPDVAEDVRALIRLGQPVAMFMSEPGVAIAAFAGS